MSQDTDRLEFLLASISEYASELGSNQDIFKANVAIGRDCLRRIIEDMEGMEYNERHLRKDCDRLRRELDDCNGIIR